MNQIPTDSSQVETEAQSMSRQLLDAQMKLGQAEIEIANYRVTLDKILAKIVSQSPDYPRCPAILRADIEFHINKVLHESNHGKALCDKILALNRDRVEIHGLLEQTQDEFKKAVDAFGASKQFVRYRSLERIADAGLALSEAMKVKDRDAAGEWVTFRNAVSSHFNPPKSPPPSLA